jgi:hypothetical protein
MLKVRKSARSLSLKKRFLAITANEKCTVKLVATNMSRIVACLNAGCVTKKQKYCGTVVLFLHYLAYLSLVLEPTIPLQPCMDFQRNIASFSHSECWNFFETRKEDLHRLLVCLQIKMKS